VFVSGKGTPLIENNLFTNNQGNGISVTREAKGEIRSNIIEQTGYGISIGQTTAPLVIDNQIRENLDGLVISEAARPILRGNTIANNRRDGLVATSESQPDLGTVSDPGNNIFQSNGRYDVHNFTGEKLLAIGNQLKGDRVAGLVVLKPSATDNRTATY
jgi:parallel beta-helix repeat protein